MRLELGTFQVRDLLFSDTTEYGDGVLRVSKDGLLEHISAETSFDAVDVEIVRPGERTRIVHALDVAEPRVKVSGPGCVFPGVLGKPVTVGEGRTHRLGGVAVMGASEPFTGETVWYGREAVVDMWGPGAEYSPFSNTLNLVLVFRTGQDEEAPENINYMVGSQTEKSAARTEATRWMCLKAAEYLASTVKSMKPELLQRYELSTALAELPGIVYIHTNIAAGVYGSHDFTNNVGVLLHPNELMDGAVVNSFRWVDGALRDATYFYQNNAVVEELYRRHGKDLNFLGVILCNGYGNTLEDKERESDSVVKMARMLGADGAVITPVRPGHSSVTHMTVCQKCERAGIKTVIGAGQLSTTHDDPGFSHLVPEADAIAIPGDDSVRLSLPAADEVVGGSRVLGTDEEAGGPLELQLKAIYGATNPLGPSRLSGRLH